MSIGYSAQEELARRIVEEARASDKVNVVIYEDGWSGDNRGGYLMIHAWKDTLTPPGTVYVRTPLTGKLHPGGVPCKSPDAIRVMIGDDEIVEEGARVIAVIMGDVPIHPFLSYKDEDWYSALRKAYGEHVHYTKVYNIDDDPYVDTTIQWWQENADKLAKQTWAIFKSEV